MGSRHGTARNQQIVPDLESPPEGGSAGAARPVRSLVAVPAAPILGGIFVVTLPFVGIALGVYAIAKKVVALARGAGDASEASS